VDWLPWIAGKAGIEHLRPLPTADLNATLGMAVGTLVLSIYYSFKIKGLKGYVHEMAAGHLPAVVPKWNPLTWIPAVLVFAANLFLFFEGMLGPTISHGFRLFGNMYAGELVFFLISGLNGSGTVFGVILGALLGVGWGLFHIMIVILQAFVFMMLVLAYLGRAHEHH
jgi:F-type H+-transporting ATPase subunit a